MGIFRLLMQEYATQKPAAPDGLRDAYELMTAKFRECLITNHDVFDVWKRIPTKAADGSDTAPQKHHVGWLLAHSQRAGMPADVARHLSLDERYNPWPEQTPPPRHQPFTDPYASGGDKDPTGELLPHPDAFRSYMGRLHGQHILVVEGIVPGGPAIMQILLGAAQENKDAQGTTVKGVILDLTGETYLGLEENENAVYYDGMLDGSEALTKEERDYLPQMEAIYQAIQILDGRIEIKKKNSRAGTPCESFSPYYAVIRLWNVVSKDWAALLPATRKSLQETWRTHYGHGEEENLDIKQAVSRIFDLGHTVNVILILSVSLLGKVEQMGLSTYALNGMTILIVAEPRIDGGTKAINAAMRDNRLEFISAHRDKIKAQLEVAQGRYASHDQFVLASVEPPEIFPLETSQVTEDGRRISISEYKSKRLSGFSG
jgi:hypothetical protein